MAGETTKLALTPRPLARFAPILIWLMLILFPSIGARILFMQATAMETILQDSMLRQKLSVEIRKYDAALQNVDFLTAAIQLREIVEVMTLIYNDEQFVDSYKRHPVLSRLPDNSLHTADQLGQISDIIRDRIGVKPDFICLLDANPQRCALQLSPRLKLIMADFDASRELSSAYASFMDRIDFEKKKAQNKSIDIDYDNRILHTSFLQKMLRTFEPFHNSIGFMSQRYSTTFTNIFLIWTMPIINADGTFRFIMTGCAQSSLDPSFILKHTARNLSSKEFEHRVGISRDSSLPKFNQELGRLSLVSEIPESFILQLNQAKIHSKLKPVLQISCDSAQKSASAKQNLANVIILFYATLMTFLMSGIALGKFKLNRSLYKLVTAGFFAGILLPLSATIWLGICYLSNQQQLKAEAILDLMQEKIHEKEQAINLQISRNALFQNAFSHFTSKRSDELLLKLNHQTGFFGQGNRGDTSADPRNLKQKILNYAFIKPGLEDYLGVKDSRISNTDTVQPFFSGVSNDVLYQLGAFSHLPESVVKQTLQKSQLSMGLLDSTIDKQIFINTFTDEQSPTYNTMATGFGFINGIFWKDKNNRTTGLSLLQSDRRAWTNDFYKLIQQQKVSQKFIHEGFEISLHCFVTRYIQEGRLEDYNYIYDMQKDLGSAYFKKLADALFALTDEIRLNNLNSDQPHLINASLTNDRQMFFMAYATPVIQGSFLSGELLLAIFALLALISSLVLARGITWVLLKSLPPFQTAIDELSRQNYRWELQLSSGDEFDTLADSFNSITVKLDEKERISRLVSRNVLDAINSGNDQLLKPGGSKVRASILFADLRGFTTITEKYPAQQVVDMLNDYFSLMVEIIENHGGIIDKLIGDAIQAVFYDHECENCALSAVKAAKEMRTALVKFNADRQTRQLFSIDNGVGICTGEVICGRVGSESGKLDATIIGTLVNQAARLESLSKHGKKSKIAIDEATSKALGKKFTWKNVKVDATTSFLELN